MSDVLGIAKGVILNNETILNWMAWEYALKMYLGLLLIPLAILYGIYVYCTRKK